jgi:hypothetical protein
MHFDQPHMLSMPIPIRFAGWESNTYQLQQNGWQLSAMEGRPSLSPRPQLQLALKHPGLQIRAMTRPIDVDYLGMFHNAGSIVEMVCKIGLDVKVFGTTLMLSVVHYGPLDFRAIDAQPQITDARFKNVDDLKIFADAQLVRTKEVVVMPDSVPELMEQILKLQAPKQADIRERVRKEQVLAGLDLKDVRPRQQFHAQILSIT